MRDDPVKKLLITATIAAFGAVVVLPTAAIIGSNSAQAIGPKKHAYAWSRWAGWPPVRGQTAKAPRHLRHRHDLGPDVPARRAGWAVPKTMKYKPHHKLYKIKDKAG
jgi:hypothetical protein